MEKQVVKMYLEDKMTLRHISEQFNTYHHKIKRILKKNGIEFERRKSIKPRTEEHKKRISESNKGRKVWSEGKKMTKDHVLKNMKAHLKYDVTLEWLMQFKDVEKIKYLNRSISRKRDCEGFNTEIYMQFILKFYSDIKFNNLYERWLETNDKWIKPSLDHITAKANNGSLLIDNLQFISWLENRAKIDIEQNEWNEIKQRINEYF